MDYKGKKVKILLQGNIVVEGIVKSWNSNSVHLIDGTSTCIITHPDEDIRVIKVLNNLQTNLIKQKKSHNQPKKLPI